MTRTFGSRWFGGGYTKVNGMVVEAWLRLPSTALSLYRDGGHSWFAPRAWFSPMANCK